VTPPDEFGILAGIGTFGGYTGFLDNNPDWSNACDARVVFDIPRYRPLGRADAVDAPTLVVIADDDRIVPPTTAERLVERLPRGESFHVDGGHFGVYDDPFEQILNAQCLFFETHLG